ncbi:DUF6088 family protein [Alcaligenes endophyticus]|uniref:Type IV toxin-antitoxin system AbiEi family antitoxin domain-containing protein n=1 Tax=Alcaligenes endophyticus TaxID=1929088 RepID=A0ABT8EJZ1_9BURK|nr:DUF6088 family protein [Alcaligenes endophyticus]MCX5591916.1 DUF6088 family protein [Alcaligenes endophyticus]MDN4121605.1 type IV toxin-antitoxin system AbiEi family antitoxin domain-containing protein [Alcaligenes endophyticus]
MQPLSKTILQHATGLPEGSPLVAKELLHLGNRAAIDQALSRLVQRGHLLRASRGIYVLPIESRFGKRAPSTAKTIENLAKQRGEVIVPHGASSANALGLTTQVPMQAIYLTSGPSRRLKLGAQKVELRHAPKWQLIYPGRAAGDLVRALAWLGPEKASKAIPTLRTKLPPAEIKKATSARSRLPTWMAQEISALVSHETPPRSFHQLPVGHATQKPTTNT